MAANETFISTGVFEAAFWLYVASVIPYILDLALRRDVLHKTANRIFQLAFVVHSIAFMLRWGEAGLVEVKAFETAEGAALVGAEWLRLFLSHPPWSNLYESLVCFAWGAAFVGMVGIERFRLRIAGLFLAAVEILAMGTASLLTSKEITPLVPALQSKWLHVHVGTAIIAYPGFALAAVIGLLYLLKVGTKNGAFGAAVSFCCAFVVAAVGGGSLFTTGGFNVGVMFDYMSKSYNLTFAAQDATGQELARQAALMLPLSPVGPLMLAAMAV